MSARRSVAAMPRAPTLTLASATVLLLALLPGAVQAGSIWVRYPALGAQDTAAECYLEAGDNQGSFVIMRLRPEAADVDVDGLCQALSDNPGSAWFLLADPPRFPNGTVVDPGLVGARSRVTACYCCLH